MLLTRSPLSLFEKQAFLKTSFDLHVFATFAAIIISYNHACIRHAASVHPEPGSNSPFDMTQNVTNVMIFVFLVRFISFEIDVSCLVFKDRNVFRFLRLVQRSYIIPNILPPVNAFFIFFSFFYQKTVKSHKNPRI